MIFQQHLVKIVEAPVRLNQQWRNPCYEQRGRGRSRAIDWMASLPDLKTWKARFRVGTLIESPIFVRVYISRREIFLLRESTAVMQDNLKNTWL